MSNVYTKLMNVQSELNAPKNLYNSFGKYSYRSAESIMEALKPLLLKHKAAVIINDDVVFVEGEYHIENNTKDNKYQKEEHSKVDAKGRYYIKSTVKFIDVETGETVEASAFARESADKKGQDESQITGATSSYSRKYALNAMFLIDDCKDADATNTHGKEAPTKTQTQSKQNTPTRSKVLSEDQIKALYEVSEAAGYSKARLIAQVKARYNCVPEYLTKAEFDHVYGSLNKK